MVQRQIQTSQNEKMFGIKYTEEAKDFLLKSGTDIQYGARHLKRAILHHLIQPLAGLLVSDVGQLQLQLEKPLVVPVPLGKKRLRERGFNQSHLIAETFAHALQLPYAPHVMARTRNTPPQSKSETFKGRFQNVAGCFEVKDANAVRGSDVLLVDDVTTSGATFKEASLALKSAGARSVTALAVAMAGQ